MTADRGTTTTTKIRLPVFVHRWFRNGANWAYTEQSRADLAAVLAALDRPLKDGPKAKDFDLPLDGRGRLLGFVTADTDCEDPKARWPTVLRAVLVPDSPDPVARANLFELLREITPRSPGPDPEIVIEIDAPRHTTAVSAAGVPKSVGLETRDANGKQIGITLRDRLPAAAARGRTRRRRTIYGFIFLAITAAAAVPVARFLSGPTTTDLPHGAEPRDTPAQSNLPQQVAQLTDLLQEWDDGFVPTSDASVVQRFLTLLSWQGIGQPKSMDGEPPAHPYQAFVARLPESPPKPPPGGWDQGSVLQALRELANVVRLPGETSPVEGRAVDVIKAGMAYEQWKQASDWHRIETGAMNTYIKGSRPPERIEAFVVRFRRPSRSVIQAAAAMAEHLRRWDVKDRPDPDRRPFDVCKLFFMHLQRPVISESCQARAQNAVKVEDPYWDFAHRLPQRADAAGWTFGDEAELEDSLRWLAKWFDDRDGRDGLALTPNVTGLVDAVADRMNFAKWLERWNGKWSAAHAGRRWPEEPLCHELKDFAELHR